MKRRRRRRRATRGFVPRFTLAAIWGPIFDTHTLLGEGVRGPGDDKAARLSARVYGEMREHKHGGADASEART